MGGHHVIDVKLYDVTSSLFWIIMHYMFVVVYQYFGTQAYTA